MQGGDNPWAVVLAGGDGTRLRALARAVFHSDLPKQFLPLLEGRSLLQATVNRIATLIPAERTVVVVAHSHLQTAARQLSDFRVQMTPQPLNRGTAAGILLPLARIRARDPGATIAIFPSDHHIPHPEPLLAGVRSALSSEVFDRVVVGIAPTGPDSDLGWIEPEATDPTEPRLVRRFVEKPPRPLAERMMRQGGLWSSFITVGRLEAIWEMARRHLPDLVKLFDTYVGAIGQPDETMILNHIYSLMPERDFSRWVLEKTNGLGVVRAEGSGWCDWGSPDRVLSAISGNSSLSIT